MRISLTSVLVTDQARAHDFYTRVLGFVVKEDMPMGQYRWLTVVSPESDAGTVELLLEPNAHAAARTFQAALYADGIAATSFECDSVEREHERLVALGVQFRSPPMNAGPVTLAVLDDTCGNWIQIHSAA